MKVFWGLGKLLTLLFWLLVLVNLVIPLINPIHLLINLAGSCSTAASRAAPTLGEIACRFS